MIERIYIKNFRCLTDCELRLEPLTLFLGENGTGKSSVFDVISRIKRFVCENCLASETFNPIYVTRGNRDQRQQFAVDVRLDLGLYRYSLSLQHHGAAGIVEEEKLMLDDFPLHESRGGNRSGIVASTSDVRALGFWNYLNESVVVASSQDNVDPKSRGFFVHQSQNRHDALRETLKMVFGDRFSNSLDRWSELSEGERMLIFLYSLIGPGRIVKGTLLLDEPDNFLSLREIQPWLLSLIEAVGPIVEQAVIISHHPELINQLAGDRGIWFTRDEGGPTRIERRQFSTDEPLTPAELAARGW